MKLLEVINRENFFFSPEDILFIEFREREERDRQTDRQTEISM